jgi:hypothetical protein
VFPSSERTVADVAVRSNGGNKGGYNCGLL